MEQDGGEPFGRFRTAGEPPGPERPILTSGGYDKRASGRVRVAASNSLKAGRAAREPRRFEALAERGRPTMIRTSLLVVAFVSFVTSCVHAPKASDPIELIGRWRSESDAHETFEFRADGTARYRLGPRIDYEGTYEPTGESRMTMKMRPTGLEGSMLFLLGMLPGADATVEFETEGDTLTLTDSEGVSSRYVRVR